MLVVCSVYLTGSSARSQYPQIPSQWKSSKCFLSGRFILTRRSFTITRDTSRPTAWCWSCASTACTETSTRISRMRWKGCGSCGARSKCGGGSSTRRKNEVQTADYESYAMNVDSFFQIVNLLTDALFYLFLWKNVVCMSLTNAQVSVVT